jgi:signal transduction histidine kinase
VSRCRAGSPLTTVAGVTRFSPSRLARPGVADVVLAALCVALMHAEQVLAAYADGSVLTSVAIVLASLPVVFRRQAPVVAFVAAVVTLFGVMETSSVYNTMCAPIALCAYSVADRHGRRAALITVAASVPLTLWSLQIYSPHPVFSWGTAQYLALVCLPLALGVADHDRRAYTAALVERAEAAEHSREAEALRRVSEERLRIARDVHDVVAHVMVTINVQAGVGAYLLHDDPEQAHTALRTIKQVSGDALTDLRSVLGILRADDDPAAPDAPSGERPVQRLAQLDELRESVGAAGVDLAVDVDPAARALPASVDATGYRIIQEAMTNTVRHAGPTTARVSVRREEDSVVIDIVDDGGTSPASALRATGSGNGLRGMRERAAAAGGSLDAGPRPQGGWRVTASLPLGHGGVTSRGVPATGAAPEAGATPRADGAVPQVPAS